MEKENKENYRNIVIFDDVKKLCDIVFRKSVIEFAFFSLEIDRLKQEKCESKSVVDYIFNRLLSLRVIPTENLRCSYYKLLNYTKTFDKELASKYEKLFIEYIDKVGDDNYE